MSSASPAPSEPQIQQAIRAAVAATDRGDYAGAMKVFKAVYEDAAVNSPPDGLSAYGLCVAIEDRQTKRGIELCRAGIAAQFYETRHWTNLINLHLKKGDRSGAIEVLREALAKMPKEAALLALKEKFGIREAPPVSFLSHQNPINRMIASRRNRVTSRGPGSGSIFKRIHPLVAGLMVLVFFAAVFGGTFYFLYHKAYG